MPGNENPPIPTAGTIRIKTAADNTADIRDAVTGLVGKGYTSLSDDVARGHFAALVGLLGLPAARKMADHIFIFNQNPNFKTIPLKNKITQFYDNGSNDADTDTTLKKVKVFGSGPISGLTDSPNVSSDELSGKNTLSGIVAQNNPVASKIKIVLKNTK